MKIFAVVVMIAASLVVSAGSTSALGVECPSGKFCIYTDADHEDGSEKKIGGKARIKNLISPFNNTVSSVINARSRAVVLFDKRSARGSETYCIDPGESIDSLPALNDEASSLRLSKQLTCPPE